MIDHMAATEEDAETVELLGRERERESKLLCLLHRGSGVFIHCSSSCAVTGRTRFMLLNMQTLQYSPLM